MLCLSRKIDEVIMIGSDIRIKVLEITSTGKVRLGIEAPRSISIHREEIYNQIIKEGKSFRGVSEE